MRREHHARLPLKLPTGAATLCFSLKADMASHAMSVQGFRRHVDLAGRVPASPLRAGSTPFPLSSDDLDQECYICSRHCSGVLRIGCEGTACRSRGRVHMRPTYVFDSDLPLQDLSSASAEKWSREGISCVVSIGTSSILQAFLPA